MCWRGRTKSLDRYIVSSEKKKAHEEKNIGFAEGETIFLVACEIQFHVVCSLRNLPREISLWWIFTELHPITALPLLTRASLVAHGDSCFFVAASHWLTSHHVNVWRTNRWSTCCTELAKDRSHHSSYTLGRKIEAGSRRQFGFLTSVGREENYRGEKQTKRDRT
jgi:hypothetical protein